MSTRISDVELSSWIITMERRVEKLEEELTSTRHELERQISDEQSDRERADDSIRSDVSSLQHKVDYG